MKLLIGYLSLSLLSIISTNGGVLAQANPNKPIMDEREYAQNVREYSKELVTAVFAVKWCNEYELALNNSYFNIKSPGIKWNQKRYDDFSEVAMKETRKKIDAEYARLGHQYYCKTYIDFANKNRTFYGMAVIPSKH